MAGPGHKNRGFGGNADGAFDYSLLPRKGTKEQVDKRAVAAQCVGGDGGFVTYDNPDTVKIKAAFCKEKGLGVSSFVPLCGILVLADTYTDMTFSTGPVLLERSV